MSDLFAFSTAILSPCGTYRYRLGRTWDTGLPAVVWVMLNPSTADATSDDPTIRRVVGFSKAWGYGQVVVVNLYALRATDPRQLWQHANPVGPDNDHHLAEACRGVDIVAAWGANAKGPRQGAVLELVRAGCRSLASLGTTAAGAPRHPLYVRADAERRPYP